MADGLHLGATALLVVGLIEVVAATDERLSGQHWHGQSVATVVRRPLRSTRDLIVHAQAPRAIVVGRALFGQRFTPWAEVEHRHAHPPVGQRCVRTERYRLAP